MQCKACQGQGGFKVPCQQRVTYEMAKDAGDLSLEGTTIEGGTDWEPCLVCEGGGVVEQ